MRHGDTTDSQRFCPLSRSGRSRAPADSIPCRRAANTRLPIPEFASTIRCRGGPVIPENVTSSGILPTGAAFARPKPTKILELQSRNRHSAWVSRDAERALRRAFIGRFIGLRSFTPQHGAIAHAADRWRPRHWPVGSCTAQDGTAPARATRPTDAPIAASVMTGIDRRLHGIAARLPHRQGSTMKLRITGQTPELGQEPQQTAPEPAGTSYDVSQLEATLKKRSEGQTPPQGSQEPSGLDWRRDPAGRWQEPQGATAPPPGQAPELTAEQRLKQYQGAVSEATALYKQETALHREHAANRHVDPSKWPADQPRPEVADSVNPTELDEVHQGHDGDEAEDDAERQHGDPPVSPRLRGRRGAVQAEDGGGAEVTHSGGSPNAFRQRTRSGTSDGTDRSKRTLPSSSMMQTATERSDTSNAA